MGRKKSADRGGGRPVQKDRSAEIDPTVPRPKSPGQVAPRSFGQLVEFTPQYQVLIEAYGRDVSSVFGRVWRYTQSNGVCYASLPSLARELRMDREHVQQCLRILVDDGWLERTERPGHTAAIRIPGALGVAGKPTQRESPLPPSGKSRYHPAGAPATKIDSKREIQERSTDDVAHAQQTTPCVEQAEPDPALREIMELVGEVEGLNATGRLLDAIRSHPETALHNLELAIEYPGEWTPALVAWHIQNNARLFEPLPRPVRRRSPASAVEERRTITACAVCGAPDPHHNAGCPEVDGG